MEEHSGEIYTIKSLDREAVSQYEFWISAKDPGGRVGFALLKIRVLDDNDNKPEFILREYSANIYANLSVGESVLKVSSVEIKSRIERGVNLPLLMIQNVLIAEFYSHNCFTYVRILYV